LHKTVVRIILHLQGDVITESLKCWAWSFCSLGLSVKCALSLYEHNTLSSKYKAFKFCSKSKEYQHMKYQTNMSGFIIKCIFVMYLFGILAVDIFYVNLVQR
jgi:hypothetical protein